MVLWEESGGHTFNIIDINDGKITAPLPVIGDKYPAPAILILCTLIESGYDLTESVDRTLLGTRSTIEANDTKKLEIVNYFAQIKGENFDTGNYSYTIGNFEQVDNLVDIIMLKSNTTEIYFRPSGTGPEVRVYVFGPASTAQDELDCVMVKINEMFP
jgi:phosphomannomutase